MVELLKTGSSTTQGIACYDLGEFCRFHPYGKKILEHKDIKGKDIIMEKAKG